MSFAARAYATILPTSAPAYLSATINGDANPSFRFVKIPEFKEFRSTSIPSLKLEDYPEGKFYVLTAGQTENGKTQTIQFVFATRPQTGTYSLSKDIDDVRSTYYSDPANGSLHVCESGSITVQYDDIEKTLGGTWTGAYDHGGADGDQLFPITGEFTADADLNRK